MGLQQNILVIFALIGAWGATLQGVWFLFNYLERVLSPSLGVQLTRWLRGVRDTGIRPRWQEVFIEIFDGLFGRERVSSTFVRRSCFLSAFTVIIAFLLWSALHPSVWSDQTDQLAKDPAFAVFVLLTAVVDMVGFLFALRVITLSLDQLRLRLSVRRQTIRIPNSSIHPRMDRRIKTSIVIFVICLVSFRVLTRFGNEVVAWLRPLAAAHDRLVPSLVAPIYLLCLLATGTIVNFIPDYFALFQTRWLIGRLERLSSPFRFLRFVLLDVIAKAAIFLTCFGFTFGASEVGRAVVEGREGYFETFARAFWLAVEDVLLYGIRLAQAPELGPEIFVNKGIGFTSGIFFYSTFATSLWLWAYLAAGGIVRLVHRSTSSVGGMVLRNLDIDNAPLQCIGFVVMAIVTGCYLAGAAVLFFVLNAA